MAAAQGFSAQIEGQRRQVRSGSYSFGHRALLVPQGEDRAPDVADVAITAALAVGGGRGGAILLADGRIPCGVAKFVM